MATKFSVSTAKCCKCDKTVYATELIAVLNKVWHRGCFKYDKCDKSLNLFNMCAFNGKPYCKKCLDHLTESENDSSPIPLKDENNSPLVPLREENNLLRVPSTEQNPSRLPPGKPINILLFGETGAGKSSVVNMLLDEHVCKTSDDAIGCTTI